MNAPVVRCVCTIPFSTIPRPYICVFLFFCLRHFPSVLADCQLKSSLTDLLSRFKPIISEEKGREEQVLCSLFDKGVSCDLFDLQLVETSGKLSIVEGINDEGGCFE